MVGLARLLVGIVLALTVGPACDDNHVTDSTDPLAIR